jgi:hypothetical protein
MIILKILLIGISVYIIYIGAYYGLGKNKIPGWGFERKDIKGLPAQIYGGVYVIVGILALLVAIKI